MYLAEEKRSLGPVRLVGELSRGNCFPETRSEESVWRGGTSHRTVGEDGGEREKKEVMRAVMLAWRLLTTASTGKGAMGSEAGQEFLSPKLVQASSWNLHLHYPTPTSLVLVVSKLFLP